MGYAQTSNYSFAEEVWNAVTHGLGVVFSVAALSVLVTLAAVYGNAWTVVSCSIFGASMLLLYTASSLYHSIPSAHAKKILKKFDHIAAGESKWNDEIAQFYDLFHPEVEKVSNLRLEHKVGERVLGVDPKTGKEVSVKIGRFGPLVQLGTADSTEKPAFASLRKDQSVNDITLEEALKLFELPRMLGIYEGDDVSAAIGRFGPYVKYGNKYVSIPKGKEAQTISLEEAIDLIKAKEEAAHNKIVKKFDEEPDLEILNGPYGVYISYKKKNYKIPKDKDATALTLDECKTIIEDAANAPKKPRRAIRRKTK